MSQIKNDTSPEHSEGELDMGRLSGPSTSVSTKDSNGDMMKVFSLIEATMNRLSAIEEKLSVGKGSDKESSTSREVEEPKDNSINRLKRKTSDDSACKEPPKKKIAQKATTSSHWESDDEEDNEGSQMNQSMFDNLSDINSDEDEEEESLDGFFETKEEVGKKISESLATTINNAMYTMVGDEKIKELCASVKRPENCSNLIVPKTNERIWKCMTSQQRGNDKKFQKLQLLSVKSTCTLSKMLDAVRESKKSGTMLNLRELENNLKDSIKLSAATYSEINCHRLHNIQTRLPMTYKSLCKKPFSCNSESDKSTELLLGKDLNQKMKEREEEEKFNLKQLSASKNAKSPRFWMMGEPRNDSRAQSSRGRRPMGSFMKRGGANRRKFH